MRGARHGRTAIAEDPIEPMTLQRFETDDPTPASAGDDHVVLLDRHGVPSGTAARRTVHGPDTPLHLGFSCHVVDRDGRALLTRRALAKQTWPGAWTNACCGHPRWGESLHAAVARRIRDELGTKAASVVLAVPDFAYRAAMQDGTVEHELCPIVIAELDGAPRPNPDEVGDIIWLDWKELCERAREQPETLTPWSAAQIIRLAALAPSPRAWLDGSGPEAPGVSGPIASRPLPEPPAGSGGVDPLTPLREPLATVLTTFLADRSREAIDIDPALAPVVEEIGALLAAGGKRLRPAFVYWGARAGGEEHDENIVTVAAAVELLHAFALLHDDVMDRSDTRRGRLTARRALSAVHRREGLAGDADWFGASAAILAGDLAFVWADQLLDSAKFDDGMLANARRVFTTLRTEVMAGQYLDLRLAGLHGIDEDAAQRVALLKSGRYTVTRPLQLGLALTPNDDATITRALAAYGDAVGVAFQIRDDVLGLFGDPAKTGKGTVDDLRAGKRTLLMMRALALTEGRNRRFLTRSLGDPRLDEVAADRCRAIVAGSGALASVEVLLRTQHCVAIRALAGLREPTRGALEALAAIAIERNH
jgi:geranylgeranyl diphosphate synthase, type I